MRIVSTTVRPNSTPIHVSLRAKSNKHSPVYTIHNVFDAQTRSAIAATGALIIEAGKDYVLVEATRKEKNAIEALGNGDGYSTGGKQPPGYLLALEPWHSFEGRTIWPGKISDNVSED